MLLETLTVLPFKINPYVLSWLRLRCIDLKWRYTYGSYAFKKLITSVFFFIV